MGVNKDNTIYTCGFRIFLCLLLLTSCSKREAKDHVDALPEIFPDYIGVTVPENICPMNFSVRDAEHMRVVVKNEKDESLDISGNDHVEFPVDKWHNLLKGGDLTVSVSAWNKKHPEGAAYKPFTISIAKDEIDPWIATVCCLLAMKVGTEWVFISVT